MTPKRLFSRRLTRREVLGLMAAAGAVAVVGCGDDEEAPGQVAAPATVVAPGATATTGASPTVEPSALACVVSPEMTEGPYFVDEMLNRSDIRADPSDGSEAEGIPLALTLNLYQVNGEACTPLSGAHVDVWHCDASGLYSDVEANDTVGKKFLRGYQLTDDSGAARFTTIYPGWYMGRSVHIHFKVRTDPASASGYEFTSQLFFDEAVTDQVHAQAPYSSRGTRDTLNANDMVYAGGGDQMLLPLTQDGQGYAGAISIGVQMT